MNRENICATGFSGLIGSRIKELTEYKYEWFNLDLKSGVDITDRAVVNEAISLAKGDILLHLAAFTNMEEAWKQRGDKTGACYKVNVEGTKNIATACRIYNKHLIHVSTEFVFGGDKKEAYTEEDKQNPLDWYGQTKYRAEKEVERSGCSYTIIRPAFPFRAYFPEKEDIVRKIIKLLRKNYIYTMFNDVIITPTFIDDITWAVDKIIQNRPSGVFHIVGSSSLSPFELAQKVATIFGFDPQSIQEGSLTAYLREKKRPYPRYLKISNEKARKQLGIKMKHIDEALRDMKRQLNQISRGT